jgi:Domain of unknown function (DUF932)
MKTSLSLNDLAASITDRAKRKADYLVASEALKANVVGDKMVLSVPDAAIDDLLINDHAHSQIAQHLDIPAAYYGRMRSQAPGLLSTNINEWLGRNKGEKRMVRTLDGTARAFLSEKFLRMDDENFAETVLPVIMDVPGAEVVSSAITETKTHIKFVSTQFVRDVTPRDTIRFGIAFSNSEVGAGALSASLFTERLVCTNGMISSDDVFRSAHVDHRSRSGRTMSEVFRLDTIHADGKATILKLRDFARDLLTERTMDAHIEQLRTLQGVKIAKPLEAVEKLAKSNRFTESEKESVLGHLIAGGQLNLFGLAQAITRTAEDVTDYDRATELERMGGKMLTLPASNVRELAMAA